MSVLNSKKELIQGNAALIVIDIQEGAFVQQDVRAIQHMPNYADRLLKSNEAIAKARKVGIPVIFIQEVHLPNLIDIGRELDGDEDIHCVEGKPNTEIAKAIDFRKGDYHIKKRRYSAFYSTDLEILLKGMKVDTLILCGGLTDVCVHYTFVDGHQGDYYCRVIEDCVAGSSTDAHNSALKAMKYLQSDAICSLGTILDAMGTESLAPHSRVEALHAEVAP